MIFKDELDDCYLFPRRAPSAAWVRRKRRCIPSARQAFPAVRVIGRARRPRGLVLSSGAMPTEQAIPPDLARSSPRTRRRHIRVVLTGVAIRTIDSVYRASSPGARCVHEFPDSTRALTRRTRRRIRHSQPPGTCCVQKLAGGARPNARDARAVRGVARSSRRWREVFPFHTRLARQALPVKKIAATGPHLHGPGATRRGAIGANNFGVCSVAST